MPSVIKMSYRDLNSDPWNQSRDMEKKSSEAVRVKRIHALYFDSHAVGACPFRAINDVQSSTPPVVKKFIDRK